VELLLEYCKEHGLTERILRFHEPVA